jgi:hypothetical protein
MVITIVLLGSNLAINFKTQTPKLNPLITTIISIFFKTSWLIIRVLKNCELDKNKPHLPHVLVSQASDSSHGTKSETLCHQHKRTHRSAKRILIVILVVQRMYVSEALVGVQFYDICLQCGNRSKTFRSENRHLFRLFSTSRKSANLCVVNTLKVCTTKHIIHDKKWIFIFSCQLIYLLTCLLLFCTASYARRTKTISHFCSFYRNYETNEF